MIDSLLYIQRQLAQRGLAVAYETLDNERIVGNQRNYFINAVNQLFFVLNLRDLPIGTKIISNTNVTVTEGSSVPEDRIEEYSGNIEIVLPSSVSAGQVFNVLFYKIVPKFL